MVGDLDSLEISCYNYTMSTHTDKEGLRYFDFVVPAAITLRATGNMGGDDDEARKRRVKIFRQYCRDTDLWSQDYALPQQVHKKRVQVLTPRTISTAFRATDGVISMSATSSLAVVVADCLPIYLAVPTGRFIGLLHSGRRSTGILARALTILRRRYHAPASDVHVLFGPSIGPCCYEVREEVARPYRKRWGAETVVERDGKYYLDMVRANERIATAAGVVRMSAVGDCTCCDTSYHSHRRCDSDGTERMLALISPTG